jgi:uncharacterized protein YkwD
MSQTTVLLLAAVLVVLATLMQQVDAAVSTADIKTILSTHNKYRIKHHAPAFVWDQTLADYAQSRSDSCKLGTVKSQYGENMGYGRKNWVETVDNWYSSGEKLYNYSKPGFSSQTGLFTQIVWKSTTKIGCGIQTCDNFFKGAKMYTCSYSPQGNISGQNNKYFIQNVLEP